MRRYVQHAIRILLSAGLPLSALPAVSWAHRPHVPIALAVVPTFYSPVPAQRQGPTVDAKLSGTARVGENNLLITVTGSDGLAVEHAEITLAVTMAAMNMGVAHPQVKEKGKGVYAAAVSLGMAGKWNVDIDVTAPGLHSHIIQTIAVGDGMKADQRMDMKDMDMHGMDMNAMKGALGPWSMSREGSGTSWIPESSPMFMLMLPKLGSYDIGAMGYLTYNFTSSGGPRGDKRFYSNSMPMFMARRETGGGILDFHLMLSADPIFNGEFGAPNLFQTGETAYGQPLVDYQHPHNLVSEAAGSYSHPIGSDFNAFVYGGPIGEPALGGPAFPHRPSGNEIPEAPISHHWFDSTHISNGVVTVGVNNEKWQLEGSVFNGHEPGENRYGPGPLGLNSFSGRLTFNPTANLSFNVSHGYLNSPESTASGVDQHRTTAAAMFGMPFKNGDSLSITGLTGRRSGGGTTSTAYLFEATYLTGPTSFFVRWENVEEDELVGVPAGTYDVDKVLFGAVRNFTRQAGLDIGFGLYAGVYAFPASLVSSYGHNPVTLGAFIRVRPGRMDVKP